MMAGFWQLAKEMIVGKPAEQKDIRRPLEDDASEADSEIRKFDDKTFPVVRVERVVTHIDGDEMEMACEIVNESETRVVLERFRVLGREIRMYDDLRPDQSHEYQIYKGPLLRNKGDSRAILKYKIADSGDYFEATHDVIYKFWPNQKSYSVDEMNLRQPIRDIYG